MKQPYIGVDGVIDRDVGDAIYPLYDARDVLTQSGDRLSKSRLLKFGVKLAMLSPGRVAIEDPDCPDLYVTGPRVREVAGEADYPNELWVAKIRLQEASVGKDIEAYEKRYVSQMLTTVHGWARGIQLDGLAWQQQDCSPVFESIKSHWQETEAILHCRIAADDPEAQLLALRRYRMYQDLVGRVIFEAPIGSDGEPDMEILRPFIDEAFQRELGVSVGGRLNAERVGRHVATLIEEFPNLSVDAESQLRKDPNQPSRIHLPLVERYVNAVAAVVPSTR